MSTKLDPSIIALAQGVQRTWHIPAAVCLAQYRIESANGTRFTGTWNWGGVKAVGVQPYTLCWTHEVIGGVSKLVQQPFRNYASLAESFDAYGRLLATAPVYAAARAALPDENAFIDLMAKKYATGPTYAALIKQVIAGSNLDQLNIQQEAA